MEQRIGNKGINLYRDVSLNGKLQVPLGLFFILIFGSQAIAGVNLTESKTKSTNKIAESKNIKVLNYKRALCRDEHGVVYPKGLTWDEITNDESWKGLTPQQKTTLKKAFQRNLSANSYLSILYQAKVLMNPGANLTKIIIDCFNKNGDPTEGVSKLVPHKSLSKGEIRRIKIFLPAGTASFELRLEDLK